MWDINAEAFFLGFLFQRLRYCDPGTEFIKEYQSHPSNPEEEISNDITCWHFAIFTAISCLPGLPKKAPSQLLASSFSPYNSQSNLLECKSYPIIPCQRLQCLAIALRIKFKLQLRLKDPLHWGPALLDSHLHHLLPSLLLSTAALMLPQGFHFWCFSLCHSGPHLGIAHSDKCTSLPFVLPCFLFLHT